MCAVSNVYDYGRRTLPQQDWWYAPQPTFTPAQPSMDRDSILEELSKQREILEKFIEMVTKAKEFDVVAKQPDCEDPQKAAFMDEVMTRLEKIEKALGL